MSVLIFGTIFATHRSAAYSSEIKAIAKVASPIAAVALVNMAMGITDSIMAASFGPAAFAAVAIGSDFYSIVFYVMIGIVSGMAPLFAQAAGSQNSAQMRKVRTAAWTALILSATVGVPLVWFAPTYLSIVGIEASLLAEGAGYTHIMALTMIPMGVVSIYRNRFAALERPGIVLRVTVCAVPVNALANYFFMYGVGSWHGFGVIGAGYASLTVATLTVIALSFAARRIGDRGLTKSVDLKILIQVFRTGFPIGISTLAEVGIFLGATIFVAAVSVEDTAVNTIVLRLAGLAYVIPYGLTQAGMVRMALLEGAVAGFAGRQRVIGGAVSLAVLSGVFLGSLLLILAVLLPEVLVNAGVIPAEYEGTARLLILILAVIEFVEPLGMTSAGLMRGRCDTRYAMYFSLLGNWGISVPVMLALSIGYDLGALGVWTGMACGNITASILTTARLRHHWFDKVMINCNSSVT